MALSVTYGPLSYTVQIQLCCVDSVVACCHNILIHTAKNDLAELQHTISASLRKIPWVAGNNAEQKYLQKKAVLWVLLREKENRRDIEMLPGLASIIMTCCSAVL